MSSISVERLVRFDAKSTWDGRTDLTTHPHGFLPQGQRKYSKNSDRRGEKIIASESASFGVGLLVGVLSHAELPPWVGRAMQVGR